MNSPSDHPDPNDLAYYAPRALREKAKSEPLPQESRSEPDRSPVSQRPSLDVPLKRPMYLRPPPVPEVMYEKTGMERELRRLALFGVAGRFAAVVALVTIVALLFVFMLPVLRQSEASSTAPETTGSIQTAPPQAGQTESGSKSALSEFAGLLAPPDSKPASHEQSPELLQRFLQWRQKTNVQ
jgi:hypothetical protein